MASPGPSPSHSRTATDTSFKTSSQCNGCQHKWDARNLVVCIDGTSNQFGQNNTNIVKLFAELHHDSETPHPEQLPRQKQYAYYSSGIGTGPKSLSGRSFIEKTFHVAIAWNVEEIVKDAYGWLAQMSKEGDRIFLFGFSRGAYQARVLAAMVHEVGLIKTATEKQVGTAYDHYKDMQSGRAKARQVAKEFKNTFSWDNLGVHFVGVWDTVSSVGLVKEDVFLSTSSSATHACHFRHALALDERRVKFMPEYFHEMNPLTNDWKPKYDKHADSEKRKSVMSESVTMVDALSREQNINTPDIKEVWFAGSHGDVGGVNRPGNSHQAGNVSLLWMRREATKHGLLLKPTDMVWVPDDLDFGISDSMGYRWRAIEYLPITHQVSFSGAGINKRRPHYEKPRRIIPGQKVHASILYSNAYRPQATLGKGFDMPIIPSGLQDTDLDPSIWETGLFDSTAATELLKRLDSGHEVSPIYLDRLLFMLRFKEGKELIGNTHESKEKLVALMTNPDCPETVKLIAVIAYYETSCMFGKHAKCVKLDNGHYVAIFENARKALRTIMAEDKHPDGARVVSLLAPLTRHQILRQELLTPEVLDILMRLLDRTVEDVNPSVGIFRRAVNGLTNLLKFGTKTAENVKQTRMNFGLAMNGLTYLLQSEDTRKTIIMKLAAHCSNSTKSRLSRILDADSSDLLTLPMLRMVLTLARIPEAKALCTGVKPRLRVLAKKHVGPVGSLAVEILLVLYDPRQQLHLDIRNARIRANLARVLLRWNPDTRDSGECNPKDKAHLASPLVCLEHGGCDSGNGSQSGSARQKTLRALFGLGAPTLDAQHELFIQQLKYAVQYGTTRERTASTMTLLMLFESEDIREFLRGIKLLELFIEQLKYKGSALLAAYALAISLTYDDMMDFIKDNERLPKNIVGMLRNDYFDEAVGQVEGFDIFRSFMQYEDLRKRIEQYPIAKILAKKLGKGDPNQTRTGLVCLDIFRHFNTEEHWSRKLVETSLDCLRKSTWREQKVGVKILSALAQTEHAAAVIGPQIIDIVEMLLPPGYRRLQAFQNPSAMNATPSSEAQAGTESLPEFVDVRSTTSSNVAFKARMAPEKFMPTQVLSRDVTEALAIEGEEPWPRSLSWMMGPACALRVLARNKKFRAELRKSQQYNSFKNLHLSGALVYRNNSDTSSFKFWVPNRTDVTHMLDKLIEIMEKNPEDEDFKSIEENVLPRIMHSSRLVKGFRNRMKDLVIILGASIIGIPTFVTVVVPVYVIPRVWKFCKRTPARIRLGCRLVRMKWQSKASGRGPRAGRCGKARSKTSRPATFSRCPNCSYTAT